MERWRVASRRTPGAPSRLAKSADNGVRVGVVKGGQGWPRTPRDQLRGCRVAFAGDAVSFPPCQAKTYCQHFNVAMFPPKLGDFLPANHQGTYAKRLLLGGLVSMERFHEICPEFGSQERNFWVFSSQWGEGR